MVKGWYVIMGDSGFKSQQGQKKTYKKKEENLILLEASGFAILSIPSHFLICSYLLSNTWYLTSLIIDLL